MRPLYRFLILISTLDCDCPPLGLEFFCSRGHFLSNLYGKKLSRQLVRLQHEDKALQLRAEGYVSNPNYNAPSAKVASS